jgi:hypothetical protein
MLSVEAFIVILDEDYPEYEKKFRGASRTAMPVENSPYLSCSSAVPFKRGVDTEGPDNIRVPGLPTLT